MPRLPRSINSAARSRAAAALILIASLMLTVALGALWYRSRTRVDYLIYRTTSVTRVPQSIDSIEPGWAFILHQRFFIHSAGAFAHVTAVNQNVLDHRPSEAEIRARRTDNGWRAESPPCVSGSVPASFRPTFFHNYDDWGLAGLGILAPPGPARTSSRVISIPHWLLMLVTAVPTFLITRNARRRRRIRRQHLCPRCAYDLTGAQFRCSECGRELPAREVKSI